MKNKQAIRDGLVLSHVEPKHIGAMKALFSGTAFPASPVEAVSGINSEGSKRE